MAPLVPSPTKPTHTTSRIVPAAPPAAGATTRRRLIAPSVTAGPPRCSRSARRAAHFAAIVRFLVRRTRRMAPSRRGT
jgi:hypothetical protein